ncbi:DUF7424 family protein [Polycladidibacter stylochi]|uniref:DUF7424 family protein n=1 Tax=Polycladidibacter stylochi TaxID=1807766 RepID=UPI0008369FF2|nr:hypothetical protein [Pseudovibrio stylochi]
MKLLKFAVVPLLLFTAACDYEAKVELYAGDVFEVNSDKPLTVPVELRGEGTFNKDKCGELQSKAESVLTKFFEDVTYKSCGKGSGMDSQITFMAKIPLLSASDVKVATEMSFKNPLAVVVAATSNENQRVLVFRRGANYDRFAKKLDDIINGSDLAEKGGIVSFELQNDLRSPVVYKALSSFVNGEAVGNLTDKKIELDRRQSVAVRMTDASSKFLVENGWEVLGDLTQK